MGTKLKRYFIIHGGKVRWRFAKDQPKQLNLKSIPGVALLNPLYEFDNYVKFSAMGKGHFEFKNSLYIHTEGLILRNNSGKPIDENQFFLQIFTLLRALKAVSLQFDLDHINFRAYLEVESLKKHTGVKADWSSPDILKINNGKLRKDLFETSCSWEDLIKADKHVSSGKPFPIYDELLLDARAAFIASDFRKSMLYCSIACEAFISTVLSEKYESLKAKNKLRFKQQVKANETIDPIYAQLSRSDHFTNKIHQTSLYLFNRSLLLDNKGLYDDMRKLYNTRNKIAHFGEPNLNDADCLTVDIIGAKKAFDDTLAFFRWLGNPRDKVTPELRFME